MNEAEISERRFTIEYIVMVLSLFFLFGMVSMSLVGLAEPNSYHLLFVMILMLVSSRAFMRKHHLPGMTRNQLFIITMIAAAATYFCYFTRDIPGILIILLILLFGYEEKIRNFLIKQKS